MFRTYFISLISSLVILSTACTSDPITPEESGAGLEYYPIVLSQSFIYEIDNTVFNIFGEQNEHFFQKETVTSVDTGYAIISVSTSDSLTGLYTEISNYSIDFRDNRVITNKNSNRELEMVYPFNSSTTFDLNLFNSEEESIVTIDSINTTLYIPHLGLSENNAVRMSTETEFNNIQNNQFYRIFEEEKGLMYELDQKIETQPGEFSIGYKKIKQRIP